MPAAVVEESKQFFFEKKNQKTFVSVGLCWVETCRFSRSRQRPQKLFAFFSEKEAFLR